MYDCIIVGGGVAGMTAAIVLGRSKKKVLLIEQCKELGKKIYATGNGRCNFTNSYYDEEVYRGEEKAFAQQVYAQFPYTDTISFMHSIGVLQQEKNGYFYPYTNQAKTVVAAMIAAIDQNYVTLCLDRIVKQIQKKKQYFHVTTSYGEFDAKTVLLAMGGKAMPSLPKETFLGYTLAQQLGHRITSLVPALCALYGKGDWLKQWKGIRANGAICLYSDKLCTKAISPKSTGELQLTDYGVSGVPVFQISRYAAKELQQCKEVYGTIDFLPEYSVEEITNWKTQSAYLQDVTVLLFVKGCLQETLAKIVLAKSQIQETQKLAALSETQWNALLRQIKQFPITIYKTADFDRAQVTAGGVATAEIVPQTMQSKVVEGIYFAGELLDVDGTCGGYNIQFAISSAQVAAKAIAQRNGE